MLAPAALDVVLPVGVELLHHEDRPPAGLDGPAQRLGAQAVQRPVVVHLAEQRDRVAAQPLLPRRSRGAGRGRAAGEPRQRERAEQRGEQAPPAGREPAMAGRSSAIAGTGVAPRHRPILPARRTPRRRALKLARWTTPPSCRLSAAGSMRPSASSC
jgi:hypothetical protein